MRLTLRTLLAYQHGVLSRADHDDLHRRIQQSDDATRLLRRIDVLTHQSQVLSPRLAGKAGVGDDANTVAEYLDDASHGSRVLELERICLGSDVHLAELANCHELLATALHTQVLVPQSLRQMAIRIGDPKQREAVAAQLLTRSKKGDAARVEAGGPSDTTDGDAAIQDAVQHAVPMVTSGGVSIRPEGFSLESGQLSHDVPEYLVGSGRGLWKIPAAIAVLAILLAAVAWQALGPWDRLRELYASTADVAPKADGAVGLPESELDEESVSGEQPSEPKLSEATLPPSADSPPLAGAAADAVASDLVRADVAPPQPSLANNRDARPGQPADAPIADGVSQRSGQALAKLESDTLAGLGDASKASIEAPPEPVAPSSDTTADAGANVADVMQAAWQGTAMNTNPLALARIGGDLRRISAGQSLPSNTDFLIPPGTRGQIELPDGVNFNVIGPTRLNIQATGIKSSLCHGLVRSGSGSLELACPSGKFEILPMGASSITSVEVAMRRVQAGAVIDPSAYKSTLVVMAVEGDTRITFQAEDGSARTVDLQLGEGLAAIEGDRPVKFRLVNIPAWLRDEAARPIDLLASQDFEQRLVADAQAGSVAASLNELVHSPRAETAALAAQTALMNFDWQPLVGNVLSDDRFRGHWAPSLDLAREVLGSQPDEAEKLRDALIAKSGVKRGEELYQLIVGVSEAGLSAGSLVNLASQLDSDSLPVRVAAAYQLKLLTGETHAYQPFRPTRASIQQWRRDLVSKRLPLIGTTDPIVERAAK